MQLFRYALALVGLSIAYGIEPTPILIDVLPGETRCVGDSVRVGEDTTFTFRAAPVDGPFVDKVKVILEHPNGEEPFIAELTEKEQFHRVDKGEGGGTYRVCFHNLKTKGRSTRVELVETTLAVTKGASQVAKHLQPADELLKHAKDLAKSLSEQLRESASSEREGIDSDKVLRSRINFVALFTVVVLLSVSGWQLSLLNKFFRSKKLI
ncbi:Transmembrane emp24 domain-containing protein 10 precursor [Ectocarpus siliculosus]|uniref:Transmembrane emp24 domain-containing protein 10 n=1 Tax=Ectocarpus siliculosus TaxID=2880 RepID=D7FIG8_ECTSI|nr:Transmembrane emp24 domain-containing protein 10 precursor [Ectocarpus siliculosus]|eukprot:CBJ28791.1 Transmembrane emp24 domain-containing protein 10 precursor [Ectocarpus siliculosus]